MSNPIFDGPVVSLDEMMKAREIRSFRQQSLLEKYVGTSLLSMTMNIPGPVKTSKALGKAFDQMIVTIEKKLEDKIQFSKKLDCPTGWEYYLVSDLSSLELKKQVMALEENSPIGRLFDLDVIELNDGHVYPISRSDLGLTPRICYVCSAIAKECSRSRKHSIEEMQEAISNLLTNQL